MNAPINNQQKVQAQCRTTQELVDQIDAAARANHRNRSQEIEYRLIRSFDRDRQPIETATAG